MSMNNFLPFYLRLHFKHFTSRSQHLIPGGHGIVYWKQRCDQTKAQEKRLHTDSNSNLSQFVPQSVPVNNDALEGLQRFMDDSKRLLVLTGAGISTESGIPDYRSEGVGLYAKSNRRPVLYHNFIKYAESRQRFWARNFVGWPVFSSFKPNRSHIVLSEWEKQGKLHWLVTQNVDALHSKAGSQRLTELHGSCTHRILCTGCKRITSRHRLQDRMIEVNPAFSTDTRHAIAPDGDVLLPDELVRTFKVPPCEMCGGILMPHLVFFGDNVERTVVNFVFDRVQECDAVLVIGSSLEVYSGYRFVHAAWKQKKPVAIVNIGPTRADKLNPLKITGRIGDVIPYLRI